MNCKEQKICKNFRIIRGVTMLKMSNSKKALSIMLTLAMLLGTLAAVSASSEVDPAKTAVYLNDGFHVHSSTVKGDIYSANGDIEIANSGGIEVTGSIYMNENNKFTLPQWLESYFLDKFVKLSNTEFNAPEVTFITPPEIDNVVEYFNTGDDAEAEKVTQNTYYKNLEIDATLKVDTSDGDIYIVADKISFSSDKGRIERTGEGSLFLFINGNLNMSGAQTIAGTDRNEVKTHVFVNGNVNLSNTTWNVEMHANIYVDGDQIGITTTKLYGNVVSNNAKIFNMPGAISEIFGTVYVPAADAIVRSSCSITGRIVANSLQLMYSGKITYNESYATLTMPTRTVEKYTLTVEANPPEGGAVTPATIEVNKGETVTLTVIANEGYEFIGFSGGSILPDEDGNITVSENISLTANFQPVSNPSQPELDIPEGPQIEISFPFAYLYGYENGTVGAEDPIKREEAVALVYRLLKQDNKIGDFTRGSVPPYENIESNRWSRSALEYMKYIGVYKTSYISAGANITRGEVAKIVTFAFRLRPNDSKGISFSDLPAYNKYYHYIKALVDFGVWEGYDGMISPDTEITRAEFVKTINRLLGRKDEYEVADEMNPYPDLSSDKWYYNDIMRASFGYYDYKEGGLYRINPDGKPDRYTIDYN